MMTKQRLRLAATLLAVGALTIPLIAQAQSVGSMTSINPEAVNTTISAVSAWIRAIAYTASVGTIIYAGILYLRSGSDPAGSTTAKNALRAAFTGLAIVILAEVIIRVTLGYVTGPDNQKGINAILHSNTNTNSTP